MNNLKNIKNILFDCDGVLYNDLEAVFGQVSKRMTKYISNKLNLEILNELKSKNTNVCSISPKENNVINIIPESK